MSRRKEHPERVNPVLARGALADTDQRTALYTHYIIRHYHSTGQLAPGCDARDLLAWYEANEPEELAKRTGIKGGRRVATSRE